MTLAEHPLASRLVRALGPLLLVWVALPASTAHAQAPARFAGKDWPAYGGDAGGTKFSTLTGVNRSNVDRLTEGWSWATGERIIAGAQAPIAGQDVRPGNFEATPLVVNDTMYVVTPYNRVVALDARTGRAIWSFDPRAWEWGRPPNGTGLVHRGVGIWTGEGERRVFINSRWRLIALDARTGRMVPGFGRGGEVDLTEHLLWPTLRLHYTQTSPPVIWGDLVIVGNGVGDRLRYRNDPPGDIQAFDVRTGRLAWRFNPIPGPEEPGGETWESGSASYTGHTNVWAPFSLDAERGLVYLPVGTPSNDWYGGHRRGNNLFAESIVCLDARTGQRVWHFQTVHHGLWDYDLPSPPVLLTIRVNGRAIDAVAVPSKVGFLYVFDRVTGEPVWPIEERPVPASDVPGEQASPTQPFPRKPAPFARQGFTESDLVDFTPAIRAQALEMFRKLRSGPLFTPPSFEGTLSLPGIIGGANWGSAAADPARGIVYVKASNSAAVFRIVPGDPAEVEGDYTADLGAMGASLPNGIPLVKPPYGTLTAIDLNSGEHKWQVTVGDAPNVRQNPALRGVQLPPRLGASGAAGPLLTAGGLVFLSGGGSTLYAFDADSGAEAWSADLGGRGYSNPMTYEAGGRQYIVIASGSGEEARLTAFTLRD